ncbi:MAG: hypothetical protein FLDDKLPJ_03626 [Phycisphaerae bacterium]|nr:hypothetical protein [Phycisphaerae bacterium]
MQYADGANLFEYVRSSSLVYFDPNGEDRKDYQDPPLKLCGKFQVCELTFKIPKTIHGQDNPVYDQAQLQGDVDNWPGYDVSFEKDKKCPDCCSRIRLVQVIKTKTGLLGWTPPKVDRDPPIIKLPGDIDYPDRPPGMLPPGGAGEDVSFRDGPTAVALLEICAICTRNDGGSEYNLGCVKFRWDPNKDEVSDIGVKPDSGSPGSRCWTKGSAAPSEHWKDGIENYRNKKPK